MKPPTTVVFKEPYTISVATDFPDYPLEDMQQWLEFGSPGSNMALFSVLFSGEVL